MTPVELVLLPLAVYRLTRLVVRDEITRPWRENVLVPMLARGEAPGASRRDRLVSGVGYLWLCPWCLSVWLSAGLYGWWALSLPGWKPAVTVLAAAGVAGSLLDRDRS